MPNWSDVLDEIKDVSNRPGPLDVVRRKYLKDLADYTGRNTICYYSGWLQKSGHLKSSVGDDDKNAFMACIHTLDRSKGLDLVLHTPGGDLAATESLVHYLRQMFGTNIRAIVPQIAMSAGTMIACSAQTIVMGKESNIGPIDPQFGGIPAHGVLQEFEDALQGIKSDPATIPIWQEVVKKYHPTFLGECRHAIDHSSQIVTDWLISGMFEGDAQAAEKADRIVNFLNNHDDSKTHARHYHMEDAESIGLKIDKLEDDDQLQDLVLTVHHTFMHTFSNSVAIKVVENHLGAAVFQNIE